MLRDYFNFIYINFINDKIEYFITYLLKIYNIFINMLIYLSCILYIFMMIITTTITKVTEKYFNYSPLSVTVFYMNIFFPVIILLYITKFKIKEILKITKKDFIMIVIPAVIYSFELVLLYWCLSYVPIGFYMIGRTSGAFVNVLFSKYYIKKLVHKYYYTGLILLIVSYILFLIGLEDKSSKSINYILSIVVVFLTGITTTIYNNMGEKYFLTKENNVNNKLIYLIIFNSVGFIILMPISLGFAINNDEFINEITPNIVYSIAGLCIQLYTFVKLYILAFKNISGNQLLIGTELTRRVITNIIAYTVFNEYYNTLIISANIFMLFGSLFLIKGSIESKVLDNNFSKNIEKKIIIIENINEIDDTDKINYTDRDKLITTKT